jgi:protein O-GlcNAc transferase
MCWLSDDSGSKHEPKRYVFRSRGAASQRKESASLRRSIVENRAPWKTAVIVYLISAFWCISLVPRIFAQSSLLLAQKDFHAGQDALKNHQWAEAAAALELAVGIRPRWPAALASLGTALAELGRLDDASRAFTSALQIDRNQASFHAGLASVYARQGRFPEAEKEFLRAVNLDPENVDSRYNLALAYMGQQLYTQAVKELTRASQMDPASPEILINLVAAQFLAGNSKAAAEVAASIEGQWKTSPRVLYNLGLVLVEQKAWTLAAKAFAQAQILMPNGASIGMQWAKCELELHNFRDAESALSRLRDEGYDSDDVEVLLASAELGMGNPDLAQEAFRRAEGLNARSADAHFGIGELLFEKADVPGAVAEMKEACHLGPRNLRFALGLARILLKSGQNEEAARVLEKSLDEFPQSPDVPYLLGLAQYNLGHYDNAISSFQKTLQLDPLESRGYFGLGSALAELGDLAKSEFAYRSAIKLSPKTALYYASLASLLEREGNLSEAAQSLKKAIVIEPDIAFSYYALGRIDFQVGRYEDAIAELTKSLHLDASAARSYYVLALCYERLGNQTNAQKYREKFASMSAQNQREEFLNLGGQLEDLPFAPARQFSHAPAVQEAPSNRHDSTLDHP